MSGDGALGDESRTGLGTRGARLPACCTRAGPDLEVQVQDVVLMQVVHALADLLGEQDHVQFGQVVLLVCDPVKEFAPVHAARAKDRRARRWARLLENWSVLGATPGESQGVPVIWGLMGTCALAPSQLRVQVAKRK